MGGMESGRRLLWTEEAAETGGPGTRPGWPAEPYTVATTCKGSTQACDVDPALCSSCGPSSGARAAPGGRELTLGVNSKPTPRKAMCSEKAPPAHVGLF